MSYISLEACLVDLKKHGQLIEIEEEVNPNLEMAAIHRRVFDKGGPALLFNRVKGSPFRAASNIYGTIERTEFIFRDTLRKVEKVVALKADPTQALKNPLKFAGAPFTALTALPMKQLGKPTSMYSRTSISKLPQVVSWPDDGGAFVTLPQVCTLPPGSKKIMQSNLGMYRIQLSGNNYIPDEEIGLHYQLHRGIGVHHTQYNNHPNDFKASIFIGGPPSHAFAAIMPMPEGLSEMTFAGMLANRRFRYKYHNGHIISGDADFVITGTILKNVKKKEGPFGDHLGYYSLAHDFPVMKVENVWHRKNAIWQFTVVGRPPQEDTSFGYMIHKLVGSLLPQEFPGLKSLNAVDASGVHPLLLAVGEERYMPFRDPRPEEIITIGNRILGSGQTSLAKYLIIAAANDEPNLSTHDIPSFFKHVLERIDWRRDLHFQTKTTIDTLDYSGSGWNAGSKVIMACYGPVLRSLSNELPANLNFPNSVHAVRVALPGILALQIAPWINYNTATAEIQQISEALSKTDGLEGFPLIVLVDDSPFTAETLNNFLWVTFTRSNPSHDIYGVSSFTEFKHWGCHGSLIIDARIKTHHAPPLITDPVVEAKADRFFKKGGVLEKWG
jgi:4-hydroxy-3-polyprenylbenzoate decarboxylase